MLTSLPSWFAINNNPKTHYSALWQSKIVSFLPVVVLLCCYGNSNSIYTLITHYWVSVSEPHTSAFSVKFCLYHMCVRTCIEPYVAASAASSVGHSYCSPLLPPRVPSASLNEYVQQWDHAWARPTDAVRWSGKGRPLRLRTKERCTAPPVCCYLIHACPTHLP